MDNNFITSAQELSRQSSSMRNWPAHGRLQLLQVVKRHFPNHTKLFTNYYFRVSITTVSFCSPAYCSKLNWVPRMVWYGTSLAKLMVCFVKKLLNSSKVLHLHYAPCLYCFRLSFSLCVSVQILDWWQCLRRPALMGSW